MSIKFDAVTAGHICLDVIPDLSGSPRQDFARLFSPGRLLEIGPVAFATGGPVANTGLTLNRLGTKTRLMGKVGDNSFGETVRQLISTHDPHLAEGMVVDSTARTSYTIVINPPQIDRIFLHFPGANDTFTANDVNYDLVAQARHFHLGYPPIMKMMYQNDGAELAGIFRRVKQAGVTTSLDMALPDPSTTSGQSDWPAILAATLPSVDIFLPSGEEILYMLRPDTFAEFHQAANGDDVLERFTPDILADLSQELLDMGVAISCIKLGYRGFYMHTAGQSRIEALGRARPSNSTQWTGKKMWAPAFSVDEVGATGAGDASIAGFLSALLRDLPPEDVLTMATAVGAYNVEAPDGLSGIRPWDETWRRINAGWSKRKLILDTPGWQFDDRHRLFLQETDNA